MRRNSKSERERELANQARLTRAWKKFHREEREAVLAGPYARTLAELFRMFANLKHVQPAQLIGFISAIDWAAIDYPTRLVVLHEINNAITAFREKCGLEPIDDSLPSDPDTPFRAIKAIVLTPSPHARAPTGAQPGPRNSHRNI
jgi:hypothetical protein